MLDHLAEFEIKPIKRNYTDLIKQSVWLILSLVAVLSTLEAGLYRTACLIALIAGSKIQEVWREIYWLVESD